VFQQTGAVRCNHYVLTLRFDTTADLQLISELSDTVAGCVLDLANVSATEFDGHPTSDMIFNQQIAMERNARRGAFNDFEANLHKALANQDISAVKELIELAGVMLQQQDGRTHVMRILWKYAIQAPPKIADAIMSSTPFDFHFVDDINGRTCLHEAAIAGELRLVGLCLEKKSVEVDRVDVYGRSALHYAAMNGHDLVSQQLLSAGADPNTLDMDNYTPLIYAITNGKTECVRVLLADSRVTLNPPEATNDLIPLTLACQFGHVDVALLLLQHGAQNIANTNGEYPIHLAAREGHAAVCRLLIHQDIKDVADKYSEWTPLFHSARFGHADCVDVLLEAGCDAHAVDDTGKTPIFYSAWYGHVDCVNKLLIAMLRSPKTGPNPRTTNSISPLSDAELPPSDGDVDMIPSLSLPPPIMPFRIYGHNYLDKTFLIQVALGTPFSRREPTVNPVQFLPSVTSLMGQPYPKAGSALKLVMTSKPDTTSPPHSIVLPLSDEKETFAFQLHTLEDLTLEFSFYPTFGSKTIGRAVALPSAFRNIVNGSSRVLPILDHRLHVIGQVYVPSTSLYEIGYAET
jgi:CDK inhibitor PHO81